MALMCSCVTRRFNFQLYWRTLTEHHEWVFWRKCLTNANAQRTNLTAFYDWKNKALKAKSLRGMERRKRLEWNSRIRTKLRTQKKRTKKCGNRSNFINYISLKCSVNKSAERWGICFYSFYGVPRFRSGKNGFTFSKCRRLPFSPELRGSNFNSTITNWLSTNVMIELSPISARAHGYWKRSIYDQINKLSLIDKTYRSRDFY